MLKEKVSIIIPVFNEVEIIPLLVKRLQSALDTLSCAYELVFIDDHSHDGSYELLLGMSSPTLIVTRKVGKKGKAFSLIQGFKEATGTIVGMIDADLQYSPEDIPAMVDLLKEHDVVVANRKRYNDNFIRRSLSRTYKTIFGKGLFNLNVDIQSGLKVFRKKVIDVVAFTPRSGWTFDLEFLNRARHAGFSIKGHDITFNPRSNSKSKINLVGSTFEIGANALRVKSKRVYPMHSTPHDGSMLGAGVHFKKKKYVTHTTLPHTFSALRTFEKKQQLFFFSLAALVISGLILNPFMTGLIIVALLSTLYFIDTLFNLFVVMKSLSSETEISSTVDELSAVDESKLPIYTILCPLYKESHIIPHFLDAISKLDWPKDRLDVMLLLEEDDTQSVEAVKLMNLPSYVRAIVVPDSQPKTKPKACNYGLSFAKGEYLVIYDAEDIPDVQQLKKAYLAFKKVPKNVVCLQAKLNYFNPHQNLLTRFFTAEYSLWFDVSLTGLQSIGSIMPLGGTSNHFKTKDLHMLQGWDPFNVTEDADLGMRLFKKGYRTAMIDSVTLEEANSNTKNWIRQRSRWIKGYMQTYLVHLRDIFTFTRQRGRHSLVFHLVLGGKLGFILINPILWITTISYFTLYGIVGQTIESLFPSWVFYMAGFSLVFGNFLFLYYYMIGCLKRGHYTLIKFVFLVPFYWIMISFAGFVAFYQLLLKPHYWEKTNHGLHLVLPTKRSNKAEKIQTHYTTEQVRPTTKRGFGFGFGFGVLYAKKGTLFLLTASMIANGCNLVYSVYLGRTLTVEEFGLLGVLSGLLTLIQVPTRALTRTITHKTALFFGKHDTAVRKYWSFMLARVLLIASAATLLWVLVIPTLGVFFNTDSLLPFILFTPVWMVAFIDAVNFGFLSGNHRFVFAGVLLLIDAFVKLGTAIVLVNLGLSQYVYVAAPAGIAAMSIAGVVIAKAVNEKKQITLSKQALHFPKRFYSTSLLMVFTGIAFMSLDVVLVKHYLSSKDAGNYALLSMIGKMVYFFGALFTQFINPLVSREVGAGRPSHIIFYKLLITSSLISFASFVIVGLFGSISVPILLGDKALPIIQYLPLYTYSMLLITVATSVVVYHQSKQQYAFSIIGACAAALQVLGIAMFHNTIEDIVYVVMVVSSIYTGVVLFAHAGFEKSSTFFKDFTDALLPEPAVHEKGLRILMFNWRDTKHIWAGGAEVYVHEIAKRWVKDGNSVTVFCGNDNRSSRNEIIDGVRIIRRGGTYLVYFWAMLYYFKRFSGKFDVLIDCENGIPFFSAWYAKEPVVLLIHHIHQDVIRKYMPFFLSHVTSVLESRLMPYIYRNSTVVTISDSSKKQILRHKIASESRLKLVHPGINPTEYRILPKASYPLFSYIGRLKPYKNVDIAVKAFSIIAAANPNARLVIAGHGESIETLTDLVNELGLQKSVKFLGRVSDKLKAKIFSQSWAVIQPSMVEGWGITVIEANACGTTVIASDVNGLRDSIVNHKTGLLVEPQNPNEFARAMTNIIIDEKYRKQLGTNAYKWSKGFSWDESALQLFRILQTEIYTSNKSNPSRSIGYAMEGSI